MKKAVICFLAFLLCAAAGCAAGEETDRGIRLVYFVSDLETTLGGDAITAEKMTLDDPAGGTLSQAREIMEHLLQGPATEGLSSVIPANTALRGLELDGWHLYVDLSRPYDALSGVDLTLADSCITLSMMQLEEISMVSITVEGKELDYRSTPNLTNRNMLLSSTDDIVATIEAELYYMDRDTERLRAESRLLELYEGQSKVEGVISALCGEPTSGMLRKVLPDDFTILSARVESGICYLNLPAAALETAPETPENQQLIVDSLVRSICSLDSVDGVQFMVDGEIGASYGEVPLNNVIEK